MTPATTRLVKITCSGCGRKCHLRGKSHPAVTTEYNDGRRIYHCTRACFDATRSVSL